MADWRNEVNAQSKGGTELLMERLVAEFGDQLEPFQIIPSRVRDLKEDKIRILWCHDCAEDPENEHLKNGGWKKFHKIVFVSYSQRQDYLLYYGIPPSMTTVLANSIVPIDVDIDERSNDRIEVIYTPTPHRGLGLLVPVFDKLTEKWGDKIHLHVYSSFKLYGWEQRDADFKPLFDEIERHPHMSYYGTVPNDEIRESLKSKHIFAYPSVWKETGCLCLMEAMSAGLACVHSNLGALPETSANWSFMYDFDEDHQRHANRFYMVLDSAIEVMKNKPPLTELKSQKSYADLFYSWNLRKLQWHDLFEQLKAQHQNNTALPKPSFSYGA